MGHDEFGFEYEWNEEQASAIPDTALPTEAPIPMRVQFPEAGSDYAGGTCDGYVYRSIFAGSTLEQSFSMIREFLQEEGYGEVPLPETAEDLRLFKRPRHPQLQFFEERGYLHHPVKILFPNPPGRRNALALEIYNEHAPRHLLRFHGVLKEI